MNGPIIRNGWHFYMKKDEEDNPVFIAQDGDELHCTKTYFAYLDKNRLIVDEESELTDGIPKETVEKIRDTFNGIIEIVVRAAGLEIDNDAEGRYLGAVDYTYDYGNLIDLIFEAFKNYETDPDGE